MASMNPREQEWYTTNGDEIWADAETRICTVDIDNPDDTENYDTLEVCALIECAPEMYRMLQRINENSSDGLYGRIEALLARARGE